VYDEKIAQNVFASDDTEEIGGEIEIVVTAKPGVDAKRLCREVTEEVARLAAAPPSAAEVERAVNSHEAEFVDGLESLVRRAILLASYDAQAHDPDYFAKDLARYRAITPAQVQAMAVKYLQPNARVVLTIAPGAKETK
jgi:zinc protease